MSDATKWSDKRIFTTGEAAEVCKVSQQTIIRCFDAGRLTGFRVPGSKFRRIPREELIRFMRANNIPTDPLEGMRRRVLVVDDDPQILDIFVELLTRDGRLDVKTASTGYDAGLLTESFRPHLIILDLMLPDIDGQIVCSRIRARKELRETRVLCISGAAQQRDIQAVMQAGADDFIRKPFEVGALLAKVGVQLQLDLTPKAPA